MGWEFNMGTMPYSDRWRQHRRLFHQTFRPKASLRYRPIQLKKMHEFLQGLLSSPEDFMLHYKTCVTFCHVLSESLTSVIQPGSCGVNVCHVRTWHAAERRSSCPNSRRGYRQVVEFHLSRCCSCQYFPSTPSPPCMVSWRRLQALCTWD